MLLNRKFFSSDPTVGQELAIAYNEAGLPVRIWGRIFKLRGKPPNLVIFDVLGGEWRTWRLSINPRGTVAGLQGLVGQGIIVWTGVCPYSDPDSALRWIEAERIKNGDYTQDYFYAKTSQSSVGGEGAQAAQKNQSGPLSAEEESELIKILDAAKR